MRAMITRILRTDPAIEVIGVARNGREAIESAKELRPDVVTLDIAMPEMDGLAALKELTKRGLGRVVMLSAQDDVDTVYAALADGAIDFVAKPSGPISADIERLSQVLTSKVRVAAEVAQDKVSAVMRIHERESAAAASLHRSAATAGALKLDSAVVIGASTGGPPAVETVLGMLPPGLPACFLVVQHLPAGFSEGLCRRLERSSRYPVREAVTGQKLASGVALVAPPGAHLEVVRRPHIGLVVRLDDGPPIHGVRPAVDVTLRSAAKAFGNRTVGVVLTGMGIDGAAGMCAVKEAGGATVVQDEATSVVFGMPRAVITAGAADRVVPIAKVASEITRALRVRPN